MKNGQVFEYLSIFKYLNLWRSQSQHKRFKPIEQEIDADINLDSGEISSVDKESNDKSSTILDANENVSVIKKSSNEKSSSAVCGSM